MKSTWEIKYQWDTDCFDGPMHLQEKSFTLKNVPKDWDSGDVIEYIEEDSNIAGCMALNARRLT